MARNNTSANAKLCRVSVIGAGVIGLSVATHLLEKFPNDLQVTIIADKFSPHTISSDKSGGWIFPPSDFNAVYPSDPDKVEKWIKSTMERLKYIFHSSEGGKAGISLCSGYFREKTSQRWSHLVYNVQLAHDLKSAEIGIKSENPLIYFTTFIVPCPLYLPWLMKRFISLGGTTEKRKVHQLSDLGSLYDIVINCTGLGARELVNDQQVYPVTGHIVSVEAPWIKQFHTIQQDDADPSITTYIFPRANEVILGGTYKHGTIDISSAIIDSIIDRCSKVVPSLSGAQIKENWAGIRPYRKGGVRLEKEEANDFKLIHCYGHGGDGVSLSWGCAEEVGVIVEKELTAKN